LPVERQDGVVIEFEGAKLEEGFLVKFGDERWLNRIIPGNLEEQFCALMPLFR
jgi:hypothetical protein